MYDGAVMGAGRLGVSFTPSTSKVVLGQNVDEVEGVCENEASFLSTSSPTKTFFVFSMELLKDSMNLANSVMVSELEELELAPPLSWSGAVFSGVGGVVGLATGAPSAPSTTGRFSPRISLLSLSS